MLGYEQGEPGDVVQLLFVGVLAVKLVLRFQRGVMLLGKEAVNKLLRGDARVRRREADTCSPL